MKTSLVGRVSRTAQVAVSVMMLKTISVNCRLHRHLKHKQIIIIRCQNRFTQIMVSRRD